MTTRQVQAQDEQGKAHQVESLDALTIALDGYKVRMHDQSMASIAEKASAMSAKSKRPITINVRGPEQDRAWLISVMRPTLTKEVTVTETYAKEPALVLSPMPDVRK